MVCSYKEIKYKAKNKILTKRKTPLPFNTQVVNTRAYYVHIPLIPKHLSLQRKEGRGSTNNLIQIILMKSLKKREREQTRTLHIHNNKLKTMSKAKKRKEEPN